MTNPSDSFVARTSSANATDINTGVDLTAYTTITMMITNPDGELITLTNNSGTTQRGALLTVGTTNLMDGETILALENTYINFDNVNMVDGSAQAVFDMPGTYSRYFIAENSPTDRWSSEPVCRVIFDPSNCND